jgi:hypothetical protein
MLLSAHPLGIRPATITGLGCVSVTVSKTETMLDGLDLHTDEMPKRTINAGSLENLNDIPQSSFPTP